MTESLHDKTIDKINEMRDLVDSYELLCKHDLGSEGYAKREGVKKAYTSARDEVMKGLTHKIIDTTDFNRYPRHL